MAFDVLVNYRELYVKRVVVPEEMMDLEGRVDEIRKQKEEDRGNGNGTSTDVNNGSDCGVGGGNGIGDFEILGEIVYRYASTQTIPEHLTTHAQIVPAPTKGKQQQKQ